MSIGLVGRKIGMTRIFTDAGGMIPVSVIAVSPNMVSQIKTIEVDRYMALQLATDIRKPNRVNKPMTGHFAKAKIEARNKLCEFRTDSVAEYVLGQGIVVKDVFVAGQFVDITGTSKGKGFAGTVKRHNFATQDASHGNSLSHRAPGSIGQNQTPGRVFKGKKMAGHLGNVRCTTQNLEVVRVDVDRNLILVRGAVPGAPGGYVEIKHAIKKCSRGG
ncbi:MAG: 50S ribosomal protein L3 [Legionellales bacterium RIFCSPHIGHO2_12_FULL_42_9]|nr:MAG: 50S ribosomal protein L3 [Legionellales bacterium RIFCSPHIGHO2_12_FULL_42_9]